ncbi:MAG: glycosyltransferase family 25 protein [Paracoccaceae bacterium]
MESQRATIIHRVAIKLINLDRSPDRLDMASAQLDAARFPFERVAAVDGAALVGRTPENYLPAQAVAAMGRELNRGEIGCYLSHLECLEGFLDGDAPFLMVLEDDFRFTEGGSGLILDLVSFLSGNGWDKRQLVVNLGRGHKKIFSRVAGFSPSSGAARLRYSHYFPNHTTGLVWNRRTARLFLDECRTIRRPIDVQLQCWQARRGGGLAFDRPPVETAGFPSEIDRMPGGGSRDTRHENRLEYRKNRRRHAWLYLRALNLLWRHRTGKEDPGPSTA